MQDRLVIERDVAAGDDPWGDRPVPEWQAQPALPCWWWTIPNTDVIDENKEVGLNRVRIGVPLSASVLRTDRVGAIRDRRGNIQLEGPMIIRDLLRKRTHLEIEAIRVS